MLLLHFREGEGPQEGTPEFDAEMARWSALNDELTAAGAMVGGEGLNPDAVTTVRKPAGEVVVTDGPHAEAAEILFSFYVIDAPDLDIATAWAAKMPAVEYGSVEIRPLAAAE